MHYSTHHQRSLSVQYEHAHNCIQVLATATKPHHVLRKHSNTFSNLQLKPACTLGISHYALVSTTVIARHHLNHMLWCTTVGYDATIYLATTRTPKLQYASWHHTYGTKRGRVNSTFIHSSIVYKEYLYSPNLSLCALMNTLRYTQVQPLPVLSASTKISWTISLTLRYVHYCICLLCTVVR